MKNLSKTKIIATIGPASSTPQKIKELILAGVSVFRINTSHGSEEEHSKNIQNIRKISKELKKYIPILLDLQSPKIREGNILKPIEIKTGDILILEPTSDVSKTDITPVDYKGIAQDVTNGSKILIDDGKIRLEVFEINEQQVKTKVLYVSLLKPRKGLNIPGATASLSLKFR